MLPGYYFGRAVDISYSYFVNDNYILDIKIYTVTTFLKRTMDAVQ